MSRDSKISSPPSMVSSGALKLLPAPAKQRDAISCWMDIVAGMDPTGSPVETYLRVGQEATVVVRVRQTGKLIASASNISRNKERNSPSVEGKEKEEEEEEHMIIGSLNNAPSEREGYFGNNFQKERERKKIYVMIGCK